MNVLSQTLHKPATSKPFSICVNQSCPFNIHTLLETWSTESGERSHHLQAAVQNKKCCSIAESRISEFTVTKYTISESHNSTDLTTAFTISPPYVVRSVNVIRPHLKLFHTQKRKEDPLCHWEWQAASISPGREKLKWSENQHEHKFLKSYFQVDFLL